MKGKKSERPKRGKFNFWQPETRPEGKRCLPPETVRAYIEEWAKEPNWSQSILIDAFFVAGGHSHEKVDYMEMLSAFKLLSGIDFSFFVNQSMFIVLFKGMCSSGVDIYKWGKIFIYEHYSVRLNPKFEEQIRSLEDSFADLIEFE